MSDSVLHHIVRYSGTVIPDYFHREDWVAAVLFLLFLFIVVAHASSRYSILSGFAELLKHPRKKDITMKTTFVDYLSRNVLILTANSVISLIIYTSMTAKSTVAFNEYITIWTVTLVYITLKYFSMRLVGYIFLSPEKTRIGTATYFSILISTGLILYPLIVLKIYLFSGSYASIFDTIILIISILIFILTTIKIFQIFYIKILDFFYIMLYLCTLEILPLTGMFQAYKILIQDFNI